MVRNGGFEKPVIADPWVAYFPDGPRIDGWRVIDGSVDLVGTDWPAGAGAQSLGVNGFEPGSVAQRLPTRAHTDYRLSFLLWGDPNGPPPLSQMAVRWDGKRVRLLTVDVSQKPTWRQVSFVVHSTGAGTWLGFRGLTDTNAGPALDAVSVRAVRSR